MQETDGVFLGIIRSERIGTDEFRQRIGEVRLGAPDRSHFMDGNGCAGLRDLPRGLTASEAAANDVNGRGACHVLLSLAYDAREKNTVRPGISKCRGDPDVNSAVPVGSRPAR